MVQKGAGNRVSSDILYGYSLRPAPESVNARQ